MKKMLFISLFIFLLSGCNVGFFNMPHPSMGDSNSGDTGGGDGYFIEYDMEGTSTDVDIVYEDPDGNYWDDDGETAPWAIEYQFPDADFLDNVYLSIQNYDDGNTAVANIYYKMNRWDSYKLYQTSSD